MLSESLKIPPIPTQIGRYTVIEPLGSGATSTVYRSRFEGRDYAIKLMNVQVESGQDTASASLRFRKEAAVIARMNHPNLVQVVEIGEHDLCTYVVMELVEGCSLGKLIAEKSLTENDAAMITSQVARALAEAHKFGVIHRDIKPDNILIRQSDGGVKLIDFGFAADGNLNVNTSEVFGTFQYCSPEQNGLLCQPVDARSDLYSLGAVFFECLTGSLVFSAETAVELMRKHASTPAPEVISLKQEVRPLLSKIVAKLLCKDPDDRYQSAAGLYHDLENLAELERSDREGRLALDSFRQYTKAGQEVPLVGRESDLETLKIKWANVKTGQSCLVQIEGEGGSGKSRLTQELLALAETESLVLRGKCQQSETTPFGVIREAIDDLISKLTRRDSQLAEVTALLRRAAGEFTPIVKRLSRGLAKVIDDKTDMVLLDPISEQSRFFDAIVELLYGLAREKGPMILVIDDTQWIDESSTEILRRLTTRFQSANMFILTTARNDEYSVRATERFVTDVGSEKIVRIELKPLNESAVGEYIAAFLGGKKVDQSIGKKLCSITNGNVFAVGEFIRSMLDSGAMVPSGGSWEVDEAKFSKLTLSTNVIELLISRIKLLDKATVDLLKMGALFGSRFTKKLITQSSKRSQFDVEKAMDDACRATLLEKLDDSTFAFVHDRVREAMIEGIEPDALKDAHQALADTLAVSDDDTTSERVFALARHFSHGHRTKNLAKVYEANLTAGQKALDNFANEQAYLLLKEALSAKQLLISAGGDLAESIELDEAIGQAASRTGRLKEALAHFSNCLRRASTASEIARTHFAYCTTYLNEGNISEAWISLNSCFHAIGKPIPKTKIFLFIKTLWYWFLAYFLQKTRLFSGKSTGRDREIRETLARMMPVVNVTCAFSGKLDYMLYFAVKEMVSAQFMGIGREYARSFIYYVYSLAHFGNIIHNNWFLNLIASPDRKRKMIDYYGKRSVVIAEQVGEQATIWYCRYLYAQAVGVNGDLVEAETRFREVIPGQKRYASYREPSTTIMVLVLNLLWRGHSREVVDLVLREKEFITRSDNQFIIQVCLGAAYSQLHLLGRKQEAYQIKDRWKAAMVGQCPWALDAAISEQMMCMLDEHAFGPEMDGFIEELERISFVGFYNSHVFVMVAYVRLYQFISAKPEDQHFKKRALKKARRALRLRGQGPSFICHWHVINAAILTHQKSFSAAQNQLKEAKAKALKSDSQWGLFEVSLQGARTYRAMGDESIAQAKAKDALDISTKQGWMNRSNYVKQLFEIIDEQVSAKESHFSDTRTMVVNSKSMLTEDYIDALLKISVASSSSLDPSSQAKSALDETVHILNAERAFLFLNDGTGELKIIAGRDSKKQDLEVLVGYSSTVVKKVFETNKEMIVSGTDHGEVLGSKSAVVHNLRSIIAAPVRMRDDVLGVIYLDSRLAKGMFTEKDVHFLTAIASQIGISVHTSRMAHVEAQRRELEKDLALAGTVQALFLPESTFAESKAFRLQGFYRAASLASGDWWWYRFEPNGSLNVLVGDVTGHGPASAMLTAVTASFISYISKSSSPQLDYMLGEVSEGFRSFAKGNHSMTMSALNFSASGRTLRWWSAAAPSLFISCKEGTVKTVSVAGRPLGDEVQLLGFKEINLSPGDRVVVFTDGITELQLPNGRELRGRGFQKLVCETRQLPISEAVSTIAARLDRMREDIPLADDLTLVVVDINTEAY